MRDIVFMQYLADFLGTSGIITFFPVNRSTCSNEDSMVWHSYSLRKDFALLPNSYFLCSLPLLIHCTAYPLAK